MSRCETIHRHGDHLIISAMHKKGIGWEVLTVSESITLRDEARSRFDAKRLRKRQYVRIIELLSNRERR